MKFASCALFVLLFAHPLSNGQTLGGGSGIPAGGLPDGGPGYPPSVTVRPGTPHPTAETIHKEVLSDLQELIAESQALQKELQSTQGATVSVQSFKRSQKLENLSRKIRKTLKQS
jgi:hypothetical protein